MKLMACVVIAMTTAPFALAVAAGATFLSTSPHAAPEWLAVVDIADLEDDRPIKCTIFMPHFDAWERVADEFVGQVFVWRDEAIDAVAALSARHGKWLVGVEYDRKADCFRSQCFIICFDRDGKVMPDPRIKPGDYDDLRVVPTKTVDGKVFVRRPF